MLQPVPAKKTKAKPRKPARRPGRPSKLTPEVRAAICDAIEAGCTLKAAARIAGVTDRTVSEWIRRGQASTHGRYREFLRLLDGARARAERRLVSKVENAEGSGWRGPAWLLERRWRDDYGTKAQAERRKLEAEAELLEAKAELAKAAKERLTGDLIVRLEPEGGASDLAGKLTDEELARLIVTELRDS